MKMTDFFTGATSKFRLLNPQGYNIPKPKFSYYVNFVTSDMTSLNQQDLSYFVKRIDRLQMSYDVIEMNQYNKKRLVQGKLQYGPLSFTFYDVVSSTAVKLIEAYNRFYYDDFLSKTDNSWIYDIVGGNFESSPNWGLAGRLSPNTNYFLNRIEIYEIYDQYYSQISFINPKFTQVEMAGLNMEEGGGQEITINSKYEGVVFDAIVQPITESLAQMFGLPFHNELFSGTYLNVGGPDLTSGVSLPSQQTTISSLANVLNNAVGGGLIVPAFNIVNNALNGITSAALSGNVSTAQINGVYGTPIGGSTPPVTIDPVSVTAADVPSVQTALNSGQSATSVTTGNTTLPTSNAGNLG